MAGALSLPCSQQHVFFHCQISKNAHVFRHIGDAQARYIGRVVCGDVLAIEMHSPLAGMPQAHDGAQGGGFASAVATQQHGELAAWHSQIDTMQNMVRTDVGVYTLQRQQIGIVLIRHAGATPKYAS